MSPMDILFSRVKMRCAICGAEKCDCWVRCSCGWSAMKGKPCGNPATGRCSTKVAHGKYNRKTKRYE